MEISKSLGITYQTVHAIMKKSGLKSAPAKNATKKTVVKINTPVTQITETITVKKAKKVKKPETQAIENADAN